jgi:hypothetical protein
MGNYLRLRFLDDGDGTGKLMAWAAADGFSGESGAYFNVEELEEFAEALQVFPLPPDDHRRSIARGFGSKENHVTLEREHLGISVYLANPQRGYVGIQVRMATAVWPDLRPESKKQAVIEILATYEPVSKSSRDLLSILRGSLKEAVIEGESLS